MREKCFILLSIDKFFDALKLVPTPCGRGRFSIQILSAHCLKEIKIEEKNPSSFPPTPPAGKPSYPSPLNRAGFRFWLGRFSFSFMILAFVLAWQGASGRLDIHPVVLWASVFALVLVGLMGVRERHG